MRRFPLWRLRCHHLVADSLQETTGCSPVLFLPISPSSGQIPQASKSRLQTTSTSGLLPHLSPPGFMSARGVTQHPSYRAQLDEAHSPSPWAPRVCHGTSTGALNNAFYLHLIVRRWQQGQISTPISSYHRDTSHTTPWAGKASLFLPSVLLVFLPEY